VEYDSGLTTPGILAVSPRWLLPTLLALTFALAAVRPVQAGEVEPDLAEALAALGPGGEIAIGVALRPGDEPVGPARAREVAARQQGVLGALPPQAFQLKRRYVNLMGFAGRASRAAIEALARHPDVRSVYVDRVAQPTILQGGNLIGVPTAVSAGLTGLGMNVAVLDSGIDTDHEDLADAVVAEQCFCDDAPGPFGCCPGGDDTESGSGAAEDDTGHGTSVSGIITSAGASASLGVAPDAGIVALKVLGPGGGNFSDVDAALDWVISNHAALRIRAVNMSLSDSGEHSDPAASPCAGTNTATAVATLHGLGIPVFASSGNNGHDDGISLPACTDAISVGGVYDGSFGNFSWCGATCETTLCTDVATGPDDFVCHTNSDELLDLLAPNYRTTTSKMGGGTRAFGGTSASSPYAAASALLLLEADPTLTVAGLRTLMKAHGPMVTNADNGLSFRRTSLGAALDELLAVCGDGQLANDEDCDDGNTLDGDCCSSTCTFEPFASSCDDGNACTTVDLCDGQGTCGGGGPLQCDDADVCTDDACDPVLGCTFTPNTAPCDDGDACTTSDACDGAGSCAGGAPRVCDDAEVCTDDACDPALGCTFTPNTAPCDDGDACTTSDTCDGAGSCAGGAPRVCDDAEVCTDDACDPVLGCTFTPNTAPCDDGDACTTSDTCDGAGSCAGGAPLECVDANVCTADSCDPQAGCQFEPVLECVAPIPAVPPRSFLWLVLLALLGAGFTLARAARARGPS